MGGGGGGGRVGGGGGVVWGRGRSRPDMQKNINPHVEYFTEGRWIRSNNSIVAAATALQDIDPLLFAAICLLSAKFFIHLFHGGALTFSSAVHRSAGGGFRR